jgi:preprotein translocase subunit SecF
MKKLIFLILLVLFPLTSEAYIGPGLGTGTIGVVLGILASIFLALIAIIWYPLKRLFKLLFNREKALTSADSETIESS